MWLHHSPFPPEVDNRDFSQFCYDQLWIGYDGWVSFIFYFINFILTLNIPFIYIFRIQYDIKVTIPNLQWL